MKLFFCITTAPNVVHNSGYRIDDISIKKKVFENQFDMSAARVKNIQYGLFQWIENRNWWIVNNFLVSQENGRLSEKCFNCMVLEAYIEKISEIDN